MFLLDGSPISISVMHPLIKSSIIPCNVIPDYVGLLHLFIVHLGKDSKDDLIRVFLYEGSSISVTDLCILLNALRSRYLLLSTYLLCN